MHACSFDLHYSTERHPRRETMSRAEKHIECCLRVENLKTLPSFLTRSKRRRYTRLLVIAALLDLGYGCRPGRVWGRAYMYVASLSYCVFSLIDETSAFSGLQTPTASNPIIIYSLLRPWFLRPCEQLKSQHDALLTNNVRNICDICKYQPTCLTRSAVNPCSYSAKMIVDTRGE